MEEDFDGGHSSACLYIRNGGSGRLRRERRSLERNKPGDMENIMHFPRSGKR